MIPARHAEISENELREERQIEADEENDGGETGKRFGIELAGDLRPPVMQAANVAHDGSADHDVVEMGDDEVGVVDVDVQTEAGEEQAGEAANGEQADKAESVEHRRIPGNGAFVQAGGPIEHFDCRWYGDEIAEEGKRQRRVSGFPGDEHVMRPNQKTDDRDGDTRRGDEVVTEDGLAGKRGNDFADHAHRRKNHNVHGGMRVKPEEMLEEDGVAAHGRIEEAEVKHALKAGEQQRDGDHGSAQNHHQAGGVVGPGKKRQTEPGHAGSAHGVDGDDEI